MFTPPPFPAFRPRRLRVSGAIRALVAETTLSVNDLILPVFVQEGRNLRTPIVTMPGVERLSPDLVLELAREAHDLGIKAICLFPAIAPEKKSEDCAEAFSPDNLVNRTIRALKSALPDMLVMTDVALDPYNINGHDGFVVDGKIVNDRTIEALARMALEQAKAGADIIGPSDMMDGRVAAIRDTLENGGFADVAILSYSAKYASSFYGPFRDAVGASGRLVGDKATYQMDAANSDEALRLVARDLAEGADMVMVKPGLAYLDIVQRVRAEFGVPIFVYQVSGEYAAIRFAAAAGALDENKAILETLLAFKRAGASGILTYFALTAAKLLSGK